jgi:hypothetical protein
LDIYICVCVCVCVCVCGGIVVCVERWMIENNVIEW